MIECVVFCEARADAEIAQLLADRIVREAAPWTDGVLDDVRRWLGDAHPTGGRDWRFVKWTALKRRRGRRLKVHGRYSGPNKGEYVQARKALICAALEHPDATAVILMRDDDGCGRRADFEAARASSASARPVVLAVPEPEQEAWRIVAFEPADDDERARLDALRDRLGGDPHALAHTLSPKRDDHPRGTKRVLGELCPIDGARAVEGLRRVDLGGLRARGRAVGLTAFLDELGARIVPLVDAAAAR